MNDEKQQHRPATPDVFGLDEAHGLHQTVLSSNINRESSASILKEADRVGADAVGALWSLGRLAREVQAANPGMSLEEAYRCVGASHPHLVKWARQIRQGAELVAILPKDTMLVKTEGKDE